MQENTTQNPMNTPSQDSSKPKSTYELKLETTEALLREEFAVVLQEICELLSIGTNVDGKKHNHPFDRLSWARYFLTIQEVDAIASTGRRFVNEYAVADYGFLAVFKPLVKPAPFVFAKLTNQEDFVVRHEHQKDALEHLLSPNDLLKLNKQLQSITGRAQWDTWKNAEIITLDGDTHRVKYSDFESLLMDAMVDMKLNKADVPSWFEVKEHINLRAIDNGKWVDFVDSVNQHFAK